MTELDRIQSLPGTTVIPHNAHVYGQWVVTSYYTSGVQIVDAKYPELLVEVGYYDTSPNYFETALMGTGVRTRISNLKKSFVLILKKDCLF